MGLQADGAHRRAMELGAWHVSYLELSDLMPTLGWDSLQSSSSLRFTRS